MKSPSLILTELHHNQTISVSKEQDIIVQLEENGSTGYIWNYEPLMTHKVAMIDDPKFSYETDKIGSPGVCSFKFKLLVDSGEIKLWFNLVRPWVKDIEPPAKTVIITLVA